MAYEDDARFQANAYIVEDKTEKVLYRVVRIEHRGSVASYNRLWLEDCHGAWNDALGDYEFAQRWRSLAEVKKGYRLVMSDPQQTAKKKKELVAA